MNISINCKLSLSKKLRALLNKEASLTLVSQDIVDGKGTAILTLTSDNVHETINVSEMGETSIMLIPMEIAEETPNSQSAVHASIFSGISSRNQEDPVVRKLAAVHPPEKNQVSKAIKKEAEIPKQFEQMKNEECKKWISNMAELVESINLAKNKKSSVDVDSAQNAREKLVLQEMKEKEESIDTPAWIVNDKYGMLSINDLNISLPINSPFDLSNISAKRIANSRELKAMLRDGYIRFITPKEKDLLLSKLMGEEEITSGLDVFDNHEQAMDSIETGNVTSRNPVINENSAMDITEKDLDSKTEDEDMILNLTKNAPIIKTRREVSENETSRRTVHGNKTQQSNQPSQTKPNIKPIKKLE